jgi:hypothetical protein
MDIKETIQNAVTELTNDGEFFIDSIDYNEEAFGNMCVILKSNKQINIRFVRDRGTLFCSLGYADKWYFIEDVFFVIGEMFLNDRTEFTDYIAKTSSLIKSNIVQIFCAFSDKHIESTLKTFEMLSSKRVKEIARKYERGG